MSAEGRLLLRLRRISTARLQRRRARLERDLRDCHPEAREYRERLEDELALAERVIKDRISR
jgi:hypothetical protein